MTSKHPSRRSFASDNNASAHPEILKAIERANHGHVVAYGDDPYTEQAVAKFKEAFGPKAEPFFVFNGTAANVLALKAMTEPYHAVICAESAHIQNDECGAPERFTGCKLIPVPSPDGKIKPADIEARLKGIGDQHHVQPRVISVAQTTELGTIYTKAELQALSQCAHRHGLYLHVDGARFANAAAALGLSLKELSHGIDILSFGGTKNGLICGESVVFLNPDLAENFKFHRKQSMQLASKMRFISAQFEAYLTDELWKKNALHANAMAALLATSVQSIPEITVSKPVQSNAVFARIPAKLLEPLRSKYFFYVWTDGPEPEVRWMCSFDTTMDDIQEFTDCIRGLLTE